MDQLRRDVVRSLRLLRREKTFSGTVLLTLALCLGANVAIFGVVHAVLLAPLPFAEPDRLVTVYNTYPRAGFVRGSNGVVDFFERRERVAAFEEVAIYAGGGGIVGESGSTEQVTSLRVTPSFFPMLGIEPALGRTFPEEAMQEGNQYEVVLTHGAWLDFFGGSPDAVGRDLRIDGRPYAVVGVLGEDFVMPDRQDARMFVPLAFDDEDRALDNWHSNNFEMIARLAPGASIEQARAQNLALNDALIDSWDVANARQLLEDVGYSTVVTRTADDLVRDIRPMLFMLWGGVGFVLLIGCVNIANLLLARAQTRLTDVATRLALGASRAQVAGQVLTEAVVLGLVGGLLGLGIGTLALRLLETLGAGDLPRGTTIGVGAPVLLFALGLALGAAVLVAAIPMLSVLRGDLSPAFRAGGRTGTATRRSVTLRNALVSSQIGLAFVMLIGAGLMLMSFRAAMSVDPGFDADGVFSASVSLRGQRYSSQDAQRRFWDELLADVRSRPSVASASITDHIPFGNSASSSVIFPEGYVIAPGESLLSPYQTIAGPDYFETLGIELVAGRTFEESDDGDAPRVLVIDEWLANRYWPDGGALGDRMIWSVPPGADSIPEENVFTVVGIVRTVKQNDLTTPDDEHVGAYYFSYRQRPTPFVTVVARAASGEAGELTTDVRASLTSLDPDLPLFGVQTMEERIDESLVRRRASLVLLGVFALVALFLAVIGIYGALAYAVTQRTREIGIRMALGSAPQDVFRGVVAQGLVVTGIGLVLGGAAAYGLLRFIQSLLFGVQGTDMRVLFAVAALLAVVAAAACAVPARRATRVNPVEALGG